uniref:Uncharacterized protein n=2 Tax=Glossina TaxID=44049 RepID=A0A1B0GAF9_GLOMM
MPLKPRSLITIFAVIASLALVAGQRYFGHGPSRQFNYNSIDFPAANSIRDPRQNRGPVVFPPSPPDAIEESSGVIVGASGFGFVPPQQSKSH